MSTPAKKSLGQHFLTDRNILASIADAVGVVAGDTVVEVGPGRGSLTSVLAARAKEVIAVELDETLADTLRVSAPANVRVVTGDAREVRPEELLGECRAYKLLGNLPYYAAMPILRSFLESGCRPVKAAVLVQLEVAQRICAPVGRMSLVALGVQLYGAPRITRRVPPGAFSPPPKVTSAVVAIDVFDQPAEGVEDVDGFFKVARAGFSAPRKQLRNALASGLGLHAADVARLLSGVGIDPARRAETLSIAEWARLARRI